MTSALATEGLSDAQRANSDTVIEWCPLHRLHQLQAFIDQHWASGHVLARDANLLTWQYRYPEQPDLLSVLIARREEEILGFLGIIRVEVDAAGTRGRGAWLATWFSLPSERDRSLGIKLLRTALQEEFQLIGCLGMNDTTRKILSAFGFAIHDSVPRWILPVSSPAWRRVVGCETSELEPPHSDPENIRVIAWDDDCAARWDRRWMEFAANSITVCRDSKYLAWRYLSHPVFSYSISMAQDPASGEALGLAVYRIEQIRDSEDRVLRIVEFCANGVAGEALARHIILQAQESKVAFADFYCVSETAAAPLVAAGFLAENGLDVPVPSLFQPLDERPRPLNAAFRMPRSEQVLSASASLYFTRADGDQDRPN